MDMKSFDWVRVGQFKYEFQRPNFDSNIAMDELITVLSNRRISYKRFESDGNKDLHLGRENSISPYRAFYSSISWDEIQKFSYREHTVCKFSIRIYQFCCSRIET